MRRCARLIGRDQAGGDLVAHKGVVARDLPDLAVADQVGPAIADIGDMQGVVVEQRGDAGGAHVATARGVDPRVGLGEGLLERGWAIPGAIVIIQPEDGVDGQAAGDLAGSVAAHPIADDQ